MSTSDIGMPTSPIPTMCPVRTIGVRWVLPFMPVAAAPCWVCQESNDEADYDISFVSSILMMALLISLDMQ